MFAKGKRFTLRSNASCRIYPALHVGLLRKPTQKPLRCRGKSVNLSYPYSRKRALHVCQRQTLHIAKQCFMQDLSCASRWFAAQTNTNAVYVCSRWSQTGDIKSSYPYSRKRALHVCQRQTLHIAKQCFMQDLSCASRWFAAQTNTKVAAQLAERRMGANFS